MKRAEKDETKNLAEEEAEHVCSYTGEREADQTYNEPMMPWGIRICQNSGEAGVQAPEQRNCDPIYDRLCNRDGDIKFEPLPDI